MPSVPQSTGFTDDEEVRERVKALALKVLDRMERMFDMGDPGTQMQIAKGVMPSLIRSLSGKDESEELKVMKEQLGDMMKEMREARETRVIVGQPLVPEDTPRTRLTELK